MNIQEKILGEMQDQYSIDSFLGEGIFNKFYFYFSKMKNKLNFLTEDEKQQQKDSY